MGNRGALAERARGAALRLICRMRQLQSRAACGSYLLNKLGPEAEHQLEIPVSEPLVTGQKVEVGIPEGSLLRSAMLVYLTPLLGLFAGAGLVQALAESQSAVLAGILGGAAGSCWRVKLPATGAALRIMSRSSCKSACRRQRLVLICVNPDLFSSPVIKYAGHDLTGIFLPRECLVILPAGHHAGKPPVCSTNKK